MLATLALLGFFIWVIGLFNLGPSTQTFCNLFFPFFIFFVANISFDPVNCDKRDQRNFDKNFKKKVFEKNMSKSDANFFHQKLILFTFKAKSK